MTIYFIENKFPILILFIVFELLFSIISATDTNVANTILVTNMGTCFLIMVLSFYTDLKLKTNFRWIASTIFIAALLSILTGYFSRIIQHDINFNKALKFQRQIENFENKNKYYPKNHQLNIPIARSGLYTEEFYYHRYDSLTNYTIQFYNGVGSVVTYEKIMDKWVIIDDK